MAYRLIQWQIQDFPKEGVPTPQGGTNIRICQIFQKLHEIERIWTPRGVAHPSQPPLDPPLLFYFKWDPYQTKYLWSNAHNINFILYVLRKRF